MTTQNIRKNNTIKTKSTLRAGKGEYLSEHYGLIEVEVLKPSGCSVYVFTVDNGKPNGVSRTSPEQAWFMLGEYLGCQVVEDVTFVAESDVKSKQVAKANKAAKKKKKNNKS